LTATIAVTELARVRHVRAAEARRARAAEERRRADDERVRIARELHDSVAHNMSLINLQAGVALHLGDDLPDEVRASLGHIRDASRDALVELRTILGVLRAVDRPAVDGTPDGGAARNPTPGLDRLAELATRARAAGVDLDLRVDGPLGDVGGVVDRNAYRIVQESVTNVMKHAPGHHVDVLVELRDDTVTVEVTDRPDQGVPPSALGAPRAATAGLGDTGNGIIGMRERATAVGGAFRAGPRPDGSWQVHARLPVAPASTSAPVGAPDPEADPSRSPAAIRGTSTHQEDQA
jgi:signal transduction histidine kinase